MLQSNQETFEVINTKSKDLKKKSAPCSYDATAKSYTFRLESSVSWIKTDQLQVPYCYLQLQLFLVSTSKFTFQVNITDSYGTERRLYFSTSAKSSFSPQHARIPLYYLPKHKWLNLTLDLNDFSQNCFGLQFKTLESLVVNSHCRLKKVSCQSTLDNWENNFLPGVNFAHVFYKWTDVKAVENKKQTKTAWVRNNSVPRANNSAPIAKTPSKKINPPLPPLSKTNYPSSGTRTFGVNFRTAMFSAKTVKKDPRYSRFQSHTQYKGYEDEVEEDIRVDSPESQKETKHNFENRELAEKESTQPNSDPSYFEQGLNNLMHAVPTSFPDYSEFGYEQVFRSFLVTRSQFF